MKAENGNSFLSFGCIAGVHQSIWKEVSMSPSYSMQGLLIVENAG
ncbi:hypothetical protein SynMVIR181_02764 [Synechococcus sp. MVIR-18-1]|nr:hypothetical protein SynMVIR181_02764 [Synechococcus sp. MVIR-18-1]